MEEHNITTVSIPKILAEKVKKRIEGTGFNSISSYITYILRQIISESEDSEKKENPFSKEDEIKVKERLRSLGYLD
ncbi:CopG family transcriptional regulator [Candidatus Woesearchaeota archaeon]|nr:CopG family transcriptional regulator [Candidatus Woesearchaeota archaeon]|tara:strand:+ start:10956 stop:11183 length:228 start_codon:yes stop_codon:yes gene_type:complete